MRDLVMQSATTSELLEYAPWDIAVVGDAIDFRGRATVGFVEKNSRTVISAAYDVTTLELMTSGTDRDPNFFEHLFSQIDVHNVLLEATTLGFVEVFLLLKAAITAGVEGISILYAEPHRYSNPSRGQVLHKRDFDLSDEVEIFSGVPGATVMLRNTSNSKAAFLVGYEGQRLSQALEQINIKPSECIVIFGVPAFKAGWEMDSFANNVRVIKERQIQEIKYAGAHNPAGVYEVLEQIYSSCGTGQRLLVSPIGTKPQGIGAALFACDHPTVGLLYDHPKRREDRTQNIATWHLFEVSPPNVSSLVT